MSDFNWEVGKTYKTRGGWDARVLCTDGEESEPICVLHIKDGKRYIVEHGLDGGYNSCSRKSENDLMPPKRELFVVYDDEGWFASYPNKKPAFETAASCKGKVIRFIEDGEVTK